MYILTIIGQRNKFNWREWCKYYNRRITPEKKEKEKEGRSGRITASMEINYDKKRN